MYYTRLAQILRTEYTKEGTANIIVWANKNIPSQLESASDCSKRCRIVAAGAILRCFRHRNKNQVGKILA